VRRLAWAGGAAIVVAVAIVVAIAVTGPGEPPSGRGPSGKSVLFSDSFSDGRWCEYHRIQNRYYSDPACGYHNTSYALREDGGAARFEVRPGDAGGGGLGGGERSELSQDSASWQAAPGDEWFVQMRLKLAEDFRSGEWTILTQFHSGSGSPPLCLKVDQRGALVLDSAGHAGDRNQEAGKKDRVLIPAKSFMRMRGQWFDVNLHVRWSNRVAEGGTEVYIDSTQVMWMDDLVISTPSTQKR
jgi:hypothetical protein